MKRILFLFLLFPFFLQAQQGLIVTTAGDSILIEYSKIRSVTAPTRTARAVIMYDLTYIKYDVTYSFGKIMQDADCHLIEFVDVATGKYTAVPTTSIDQVKKKRGADNGYLFSEIENARADVVYEFRETFTSMKDYLVQCAEDLGGPFEGVYTEFSVVGVGLEDSKIKLSGDLESPGNWMYYGTDGAGTKGWYSSSSVIDTAYFLGDTLYLILPGGDTISTFIETIEYLNDLGDVDTVGIGVNEFLMWDGANWVPQAVPTPYLNTLPDVDTADIQVDDIAQWDGSNWVMTSPVELIGDGGGAYGSGLAGRTAYWLDDSTLVHTAITYSSTELDASALTGSIRLASGSNAQRPVGAGGKFRYNTTSNGIEGWDASTSGWRYLPWASSPTSASGSILYSDGRKLIPSTVLTNRSNEIGIGEWSSIDHGNYSAQIVGSFYIGHSSSPSMTFSGWGQVLNSSFTTNITANSVAVAALYARNTSVNNTTMSANFDAADSGQGVWSEIRSSSKFQPAYTASFQNHGSSTMLMLRGTTKIVPSHCCGDNNMNKVWRLVETEGFRDGSGYILNKQSPVMHRIDLGEASSPSDVDSYIRFYVRKDSVLSEFMRITGGDGSGIGTSVGGVGILTSAPTATIDVNGNARIRTLPDSVAAYITMADASGYFYRATPGDVIERAFAYAEMSIDDANPDTISITSGTPAEGTDWTAGELSNFTYSAGRLTYTGTETAKFHIVWNSSVSHTVNATNVEAWLYENGAEVGKSHSIGTVITAGNIINLGHSAIVELTTNDYIELFYDASNTGDVISYTSSITLEKI